MIWRARVHVLSYNKKNTEGTEQLLCKSYSVKYYIQWLEPGLYCKTSCFFVMKIIWWNSCIQMSMSDKKRYTNYPTWNKTLFVSEGYVLAPVFRYSVWLRFSLNWRAKSNLLIQKYWNIVLNIIVLASTLFSLCHSQSYFTCVFNTISEKISSIFAR